MVDVARLGLAVDSSQVEKGTVTLHQLTGAAGQASAAAQRLAGATNAEAAGHKAAAAAAQVHNAALMAQNTVIRSSMQQRTMMIYQLNDVAVSLASGMNPAMVAMQQGSQILQGGLAPALRTIADLAVSVATKFWPIAAAVGAVTAVFAGLTYEINKTSDVQVGIIDVMLAAWGMFADQVMAIVGPIWDWIVDGMKWIWDTTAPILKAIGNGIIGTFVGSFEAIKATWSMLPSALGDVAIQAAQAVVDTFTTMGQNVIITFNQMINGINSKMGTSLPNFGEPYKVVPGMVLNNPFAGSAAGAGAAASGAFAGAQQDYMGGMFSSLSTRAQQIAAARGEVEELGGAAAAANDNVKALADDGMEKLGIKAFNVAEGLQSALQGIGSGIFEAFKKGGDVAGSILDMLMGKLEQFASSWLDNIVNNGINALFGGGFNLFGGMGGGLAGTSSITGSSGGFFPGFANGTSSAPGGMAWVGERGPELVNLPRGSQVYNHQQSMGMAANQNRPVSVQTNIINNAGVEVIENTTDDGQGGVRQEIVLNRAVANAIGKPGPSQRAVRGAGQLVRR
jgi:hypothetical protein